MSSKNVQPKWWQLYLTFPFLMALFALDSRLKISTRLHQVVQVGIVIIVFGLIHLWLKANAAALSDSNEHGHAQTHVLQVFSYPLSDDSKATIFHLPASEVKGVLDDTFELNIIDAEALPVEEVSHEMNKE